MLYCFDFFNTSHVNVCVVDIEMTEVGVMSQWLSKNGACSCFMFYLSGYTVFIL